MIRLVSPIAGFALVVAACGAAGGAFSSTTTSTEPDRIILTVEQSGGCMMMGPNCPTYVVYADGHVDLYRTGEPDSLVDTTFVDESLVTDVITEIALTDFTALRRRLPAGECQGCYDGIDSVFVFPGASGDVTFDSITEELNSSEPLLANVWDIVAAAAESTNMPLEQRS